MFEGAARSRRCGGGSYTVTLLCEYRVDVARRSCARAPRDLPASLGSTVIGTWILAGLFNIDKCTQDLPVPLLSHVSYHRSLDEQMGGELDEVLLVLRLNLLT
jgi:hypothetical protein